MLFKKDSVHAIVDHSMPSLMSEMLISKLAHDLASPVGAVENGLELLGDDLAGDFAVEALGMVKESAATVASRLKTYRLAYGTTSGASSYNPFALVSLLEQFFFSEKRLTLKGGELSDNITDEEKKLLVNMVLSAAGALPRGGDIVLETGETLTVTANSADTAHPPKDIATFNGPKNDDELSPYTVQTHFTKWYADQLGLKLTSNLENSTLTLASNRA